MISLLNNNKNFFIRAIIVLQKTLLVLATTSLK